MPKQTGVGRRVLFLLGLLAVAAGILLTGFTVEAQRLAHRLQGKAAQAQAGVQAWVKEGRDPSTVLALMQQVKPALDAGDPRKAEALLDSALTIL